VALYGGIEGGGTKFVCAVGDSPDDVRATVSFETGAPRTTIARAISFLCEAECTFGPLDAIGLGMFGPVDVHPESPGHGHVLSTPKPGWSGADVLGPIREAFPATLLALDTDVNAAALAEWRWGAAQGCDPALYLTVGTGIGGGAIVCGLPLHGLMHPEMGHVTVRRHPGELQGFGGVCPFHGDCLEGIASAPALERRWGAAPDSLPHDHPAWDLEAWYLAQGLTSCIYTLAPQRIVVGGGVMHRFGLLAKVREQVRVLLGGYVASEMVGERIGEYIVEPALGDRAGVLGALALAASAAAASGAAPPKVPTD
jgi:fructokinase